MPVSVASSYSNECPLYRLRRIEINFRFVTVFLDMPEERGAKAAIQKHNTEKTRAALSHMDLKINSFSPSREITFIPFLSLKLGYYQSSSFSKLFF